VIDDANGVNREPGTGPSDPARDPTQCRVWRGGKVIEDDFPFHELSDKMQQPDVLVWMDLESPDHELMCRLADELSLDVNAVEDAVAEHERPKLTRYPTHLFITAYSARLDPGDAQVALARISLFVMGNALITVRKAGEFDMKPVLSRWDDNGELLMHGVGALVHGLLDVVVDSHFDTVQSLDDAIETLEDDLFDEKPQTKQVQRHTFELRNVTTPTGGTATPSSTRTSRTCTTTPSARRNGRSRCATWSGPSSRPTCHCRTRA